jgi:hypothetical protein
MEFPTAGKINLNVLEYGSFFSYYLLAFSGIFAFVYLFKKEVVKAYWSIMGEKALSCLHFTTL